MKELLEQLSRLESEMSAMKSCIDMELQPRIIRWVAAERTAIGDKDHSFPHKNFKSYDWQIWDDGTLMVSWEETWSRGGHDCGSFHIPMAIFTDDGTALAIHEADCEKRRLDAEKRAADEQETRERRLLATLQAKFPPNGDTKL